MWAALITVDRVASDEMSARTYPAPRTDTTPPAVSDAISTAEAELVYLYLRTTDAPTVDELHHRLGMGKLSLFPVLDTLRERGLIDGTDVADRGEA